jgi:CubicO group peptidase (beta-lactamase class C family)
MQKTDQLRTMMKTYESAQHTVVGMRLEKGEAQFTSAGAPEEKTAPEDLLFEIGSITKVFTAILLCVLVEEGKVDPAAPLREMASELADVPAWITPQSLTSHISGLPRIHVPIWKALIKPLPDDPYAAFSRADLLAWMRNWQGKDPGGTPRHLYSNLGSGLLGEAMALSQGQPFMRLLSDKVITPMGLTDTGYPLRSDQQDRFMPPRHHKGHRLVPWTFQSMAAAGCLRSSAGDFARFADHVLRALNAQETTLDRAICRSTRPVFGLGPRGRMQPSAQCSGWISMALSKTAPGFIYHDGATAGSTCAIYICPDKHEACAVLSNNGIVANLWGSAKLSWSNQLGQVQKLFTQG